VPRGVQYAVLPRFDVVSGGGRSGSSRAGCRSQQRRAELGSSSLQAEINYGDVTQEGRAEGTRAVWGQQRGNVEIATEDDRLLRDAHGEWPWAGKGRWKMEVKVNVSLCDDNRLAKQPARSVARVRNETHRPRPPATRNEPAHAPHALRQLPLSLPSLQPSHLKREGRPPSSSSSSVVGDVSPNPQPGSDHQR
jgi:hypothetical protein